MAQYGEQPAPAVGAIPMRTSASALHERLSVVWDSPTRTNIADLAPSMRWRFCCGLFNQRYVRHLTYFRLTLAYLLLVMLAGGLILLLSEGLSFVDAMFMATSATCVTGLVVVDTASLSTSAQAVLLVLIQLGGIVLLTVPPLAIRIYYLRKAAREQRGSENAVRFRFECAALWFLARVVIGYALVSVLCGMALLGAAVALNTESRQALVRNDVSIGWWTVFHTVSAFNNAGFSVLASSLIEFQHDRVVLLTIALLTVVGNVYFPVILRLLVAGFFKLARSRNNPAPHIKYCLVRPSVVFTHLFPPAQTRALAIALFCLFAFEFVISTAFDMTSAAVDSLPVDLRVLNLFAQTVYTRTSGFNSVQLDLLNAGFLVLVCLSMVISAYPFIVTSTDLRPDRLAFPEDAHLELSSRNRDGIARGRRAPHGYWRGAFRALAHYAKTVAVVDATWVFSALLTVAAIESDRIAKDPQFTMFKLVFELCSAYGTVGLSLGYPGKNYSFSGELTTPSKLVVMLVMVLGRCRGYLRFVTTTPPGKLEQLAALQVNGEWSGNNSVSTEEDSCPSTEAETNINSADLSSVDSDPSASLVFELQSDSSDSVA